jgi:maltooligosyltrehalose trehalohydrolase
VPDPQDPETFRRSKLNWDEVGSVQHADVLDWHRRLIALRRATPALTDGRFDDVSVEYDEAGRWLVYSKGPLTVAANVGGDKVTVPVPESAVTVLASPADEVPVLSGGDVVLPPESVIVSRTP